MSLLVVSQADVREHLAMKICIELMETALTLTSKKLTIQPLRTIHALPHERGFGLMPGHLSDPHVLGAKVIAVYPENFDKGLQSHQGGILLFDGETGTLIALVHGGEITAIRTAAASAAATKCLSREDSKVMAVLGYGEQARNHVEAILQVRDITEVRVWGRSKQKAEVFARTIEADFKVKGIKADTVQKAIVGADIVCTTTAAPEPILNGEWLEEGMHLNIVGSSGATTREIDAKAVKRSRYYADYRYSVANQSGDLLAAQRENEVDENHIVGEVGEVLIGQVAGRQSDKEITLYKSLGHSAQDLMAAHYLYEKLVNSEQAVKVPFSE